MTAKKGTFKTCSKGPEFYKSSDCPVCLICENENKPDDGFLSEIGGPARRAPERKGATTLHKLSELTEKEVLALHGIGPSAIPKLKEALALQGLSL